MIRCVLLVGWALGTVLPATAIADDPLAEGRALFEAAQYKEAERIFQEALDTDGDNAEANYYAGMIRYYAGDYKKATKYLETAVELEDQNIDYRNALGNVYRDRLRGASFISAKKWSGKWQKNLESSYEIAPDNIEVLENLIGYYLHAPGLAGGDKEKGKRLAEKMIEVSEVDGRLMLAYAYRRLEQFDLANAEYAHVVEIAPEHYQARGYWGFMLLAEEDYAGAEQKFREALEVAPDKPNGYFYMGEYHSTLKNWDEAIAFYQKALDIEPRFSDARFAMGQVYEETKNKADALAQYNKVLELTPGHYTARDARTRVKRLTKSRTHGG
jgi:tetratricopeptide (TPR) repeat protein